MTRFERCWLARRLSEGLAIISTTSHNYDLVSEPSTNTVRLSKTVLHGERIVLPLFLSENGQRRLAENAVGAEETNQEREEDGTGQPQRQQ